MREQICPICKSDKYTLVYPASNSKKNIKYSPSDSTKEQGEIIKCLICNTIRKYDFPENKYLRKGYEESIDEQYLTLIQERKESFNEVLNLVEKYSEKGNLLDIGCGEGTLVYLARKRGWNAEGVEPNKNFIKWARKNYKLNLFQGSVENKKLKKEKYDVITLLDVIEHVSDPINFLKKCNSLLKPNGIIFISTPDFGSILSKILKKNWFYILSIHLFYFTKKTILLVLEKAEFKLMKAKPYYLKTSLGYFTKKSRNYLGIFGAMIDKTTNFLSLKDKKIVYWLGQTIFIARKI